MNNNSLYDAFSKVDEKYLLISENFESISDDFKKQKTKKIWIISSVCGFSFVFAALFFGLGKDFWKTGSLKNTNSNTIEIFTSDTSETTAATQEEKISGSNLKSSTQTQKNPSGSDKASAGIAVNEVTDSGSTDSSAVINESKQNAHSDSADKAEKKENEKHNPDANNNDPNAEHSFIFSKPETDLKNISSEEWLADPDVVWGSAGLKGDAGEIIPKGTVKISDALCSLFNINGGTDTIYAVLVDFSSCIDENELLNWEYDGSTIAELQNRCSELQIPNGKSYTYVGSDGIEHTGYLTESKNKAEEKVIIGKINDIKAAFYKMQIQKFENSFDKNGLGIYTYEKYSGDVSKPQFYTFGTKSSFAGFKCSENEAFIFWPAEYFK